MRDDRGRPKPAGKRPRKASAKALENAALYYLKRYSSTVQQLKQVLTRKVDRSVRLYGTDRAEALGWIEGVVEKLVRLGLVSDASYAQTKARSLRASGRSARAISQRLRMKGVSAELVTQKLFEATQEVSEEDAARIWARKKRLGPYCRDATKRQERRLKDLGSLARAGFSFATAKKLVDERT